MRTRILDTNLGFQPELAAVIKLDYDDKVPSSDANAGKRAEIFQQILTRIDALPGVETAGISDYLPLGLTATGIPRYPIQIRLLISYRHFPSKAAQQWKAGIHILPVPRAPDSVAPLHNCRIA